MFKSMSSRLRQFTSCDSGNVAIMFGLCAIPIMVGAGSAVDFGRYTNTHQDVAISLDAGLMAAAASIYDDDDITDADIETAKVRGKEFFKSDLGNQFGALVNDPVFEYNRTTRVFKASVTGKVDTNFLIVAGISSLDLDVQAEATVGRSEIIGSDVEVTMMLDVTGSMCNYSGGSYQQPCTSSDSMTSLKTAAKDLVREVIWADQRTYTSRIAIVPFSSRVRLAQDGQANSLFAAVTGMPTTWSGYTYNTTGNWVDVSSITQKSSCEDLNDHRWRNSKCQKKEVTITHHIDLKAKPCVTERYVVSSSSLGLTENAPGLGGYSNANAGTRAPISQDSATTAVSPDGSTQATALSSIPANYSTDGVCDGNSINNANTLVPLTSNETTLNTRIDGLVAENGTAGVLGTSFAWYTISPEWANIWGQASAPESYAKMAELNEADKPKLFKIAVLMTDGEYNTAIAVPGGSTVSTLNSNALALCSAMKLKKIEVYTVGFKLPSASASRTMLDNCATDGEGYFYDATDSAKLKDAFKKIGERIKSQAKMEIRLSQ